MLDFGTVYWKPGSNTAGSPEKHFLVVLAVDDVNKQVWYQTLSSQLRHIFQFPGEKLPYVDVDAVTFVNPRKYPYSTYLTKDTCIIMTYGVTKESKAVFEQNVKNKRYKPQGKIIDHNKISLILSLKCATEHYRLSESERLKISNHWAATK